ncbi:MAG: FAD-dependent oxidoreductase [Bacteroidota bacterium]
MASYDYDLIVIGGGAAGLTASGIAANLGAKTLMIERHRLGGDCTWTGCVPSKTLLKAAKVAHEMRTASKYGLANVEPTVDLQKVMAHVHQIREDVYDEADAPEIYEDMGITVRHGAARFTDEHTITIEGGPNDHEGGPSTFTGRLFIIAAGASGWVPPVPGLDTVPYVTNDTLFEMERLPEHLAIVGGGPIGTEMSQAFRWLGSRVTVIDGTNHILQNDDPDLAAMLQSYLEEQGVEYAFGANADRVSLEGSTIRIEAGERVIEADALLMATGRRANVNGLGLEEAGVEYTPRGIIVDDHCKTNQSHIYAVGDVTGRYQFTHMSEHMAKVAATNAVLKLPSKIDTKHVPWVTYTEPELAHVGATQKQLDEAGTNYDVYRFPYDRVDRAITDGETVGMIKVFAKSLTGTILGATVLGARAGELICEYAVAMKGGVSLREIADTIHPYPTYGLGARRAADQWYARKQSKTVTRFVQTLFGYRGEVQDVDPDRIV